MLPSRSSLGSSGANPSSGRDIFLRYRTNDKVCHQHHQFCLVVDVIPLGAEQRAENLQLLKTGQTVDGFFGLFLARPPSLRRPRKFPAWFQ